ncbi:hypothetical protein BGW36DRAFT_463869 [Talaromyces proteolyticus]|uniref:ChrR-like cupin domain-containing protein n=1 Tax=Talaromyces proteolyticus TaxID=1131652 RepID=A0AAD4KMG3_9EURO|nr:uncharacterized protein BGW36DRAFT_463869 [Talaromyces proteolyticus]KAH8692590.1 hypothetical protein BGW36DRAFT_463869 [Talaromyces proteolyticus]
MSLTQQEFTTRPPHPAPGTPPVWIPTETNQWYSIGPGIWELHLNGERGSHNRSVLQWYEPGATSATDEVITHTYIEEVCFLEGGLEDISLGKAWGQGAYAFRLPGMRHGPYKADGERGCLMFVKLVPGEEGGSGSVG